MYGASFLKTNRTLNNSLLNKSVLAESEVVRLQRELDSYTKKLEHEKR